MDRYDVIVIGSGMGGGTLAGALAKRGIRVLVLERGPLLPNSEDLWNPDLVFAKGAFKTTEPWFDKRGKAFYPGAFYTVGGNSRFFGAALLRFRERDFAQVQHYEGISPAWPLSYRDIEPFYHSAERLMHVHGHAGADPTEPWRSSPYLWPAIDHEPFIGKLAAGMRRKGMQPFPLPLGIMLDEGPNSATCLRCGTCDGFGCRVGAKADSYVTSIRPGIGRGDLTLLTEAKVTRLETGAGGREITRVWAEYDGVPQAFSADIVVLAAGAVNSAALLLGSASDHHPHGLANGSGVVGRHYMAHSCSTFVLALGMRPHDTQFPKTIGINDWYWGEEGWPYPMGHIQTLGKVHGAILASRVRRLMPRRMLNAAARHALALSVTSEDLPRPENRVRLGAGGRVELVHTLKDVASHRRLVRKLARNLVELGFMPFLSPVTLADSGHQCGTVRMGSDPAQSAVDAHGKAHEVDNLYVADASVFPSSAATNPGLTVCANALRVAAHILTRLRPAPATVPVALPWPG